MEINVTERVNVSQTLCDAVSSRASESNSFIDYYYLFYCVIGIEHKLVILVVAFIWLSLLFTGLGVTADDFLCPSLLLISKSLKLSQNVAGVTFLAFGNGAPDIFSSLAGIRQSRPELVIGELFGSGIFVSSVVAGSIFLCGEFSVMRRPLLRDIIFYLFSAYFVWYIFFDGKIYLTHAIAFMVLYLIYIVVVIGGRIIHKMWRKRQLDASTTVENPEANTGTHLLRKTSTCMVYQHSASMPIPISTASSLRSYKSFESGSVASTPKRNGYYAVHHHLDNAIYSITHEETDLNNYAESKHFERSKSIHSRRGTESTLHRSSSRDLLLATETDYVELLPEWKDLILHICPIDVVNWKTETIFSKMSQIWKAPIYFLLTMTIPVVDYESHRDNWCRFLNAFHCISGPVTVLILTQGTQKHLLGIPLILIVFCFGLLLFFTIALTSSYRKPILGHITFGYLGFIVSVIWIYAMANEVVCLLQNVGLVFGLSDTILGLTVLAWGNSLGDLVSNISMARQGYPRMGLSACFGGPLLNLLLGIGLPYTVVLADSPNFIELKYSRTITLLISVLFLSLFGTLFIFLFTGFQAKRFHGGLLLATYAVYLTTAICLELKIV